MTPSWLDRLLGRSRRPEPEPRPEPPRPRPGADPLGGRRVLRPVDAAAIRVRVRKLGLADELTDAQRAELDRHVLEACRSGEECLWWEPLRAWLRQVAYNPTVRVPMRTVHAEVDTIERLTEQAARLEALLAPRRIQVVEVLRGDGARADPADPVVDGAYLLRVRSDGAERRLPFAVEDGRVDVAGLVARLNEELAERGLPERLLLLPPDGELHGVVCCLEPVARQAAVSGWGSLPGVG